MYSDNGINFKGAERELRTAYRSAIRDADFLGDQAVQGIMWHYIPPAAPNFGGLWEAAVKSVKRHLRRRIGAHHLTLTTLLCRIESCLNSRPLATLSDSLEDTSYLTPGHFLISSSLETPLEPSILDVKENRLNRWQMVRRITEQFWKSWTHDYLNTLQQRSKWRDRNESIKPGLLVLLKTPLPPAQWALGRIVACHPGPDGLIQVVTVKTQNTEFKRPMSKICLLPIDINTHAVNNN